MQYLPVIILIKILKFVDEKTLVKSIPAVCKYWRVFCRDQLFIQFNFDDYKYQDKNFLNTLVSRFAFSFHMMQSQEWMLVFCKKGCLESLKTIDLSLCEGKADNDGQTPILLAACSGHLDVVQYLVEKANQNADVADKDGFTPIHAATSYGHLDIVRYLFEEAEVDAGKANNYGATPIWIAADGGYLDIVQYLVDEAKQDASKADNDDWTPLEIAICNGYLDVVEYLHSVGAKE